MLRSRSLNTLLIHRWWMSSVSVQRILSRCLMGLICWTDIVSSGLSHWLRMEIIRICRGQEGCLEVWSDFRDREIFSGISSESIRENRIRALGVCQFLCHQLPWSVWEDKAEFSSGKGCDRKRSDIPCYASKWNRKKIWHSYPFLLRSFIFVSLRNRDTGLFDKRGIGKSNRHRVGCPKIEEAI